MMHFVNTLFVKNYLEKTEFKVRIRTSIVQQIWGANPQVFGFTPMLNIALLCGKIVGTHAREIDVQINRAMRKRNGKLIEKLYIPSSLVPSAEEYCFSQDLSQRGNTKRVQ